MPALAVHHVTEPVIQVAVHRVADRVVPFDLDISQAPDGGYGLIPQPDGRLRPRPEVPLAQRPVF
jgi:hypothetical protein